MKEKTEKKGIETRETMQIKPYLPNFTSNEESKCTKAGHDSNEKNVFVKISY